MTEEKIQLIIGSLLHDIGKVLYRQGDGRKHSVSGYDFLKDEAGISEKNILDSVRYHHGAELRQAALENDSQAYITYIADNIAASADRRKSDGEEGGFQADTPLESVFNILNGNDKKMYYHKGMLGEGKGINNPTEAKEPFDEHFYYKVKDNISDNLKGIEYTKDYVNSLLEILEANLSYVPSSTAKDELADISLFDHVKMTAAFSSCIYEYMESQKIRDYKEQFFNGSRKFYDEKAFILMSMDISGIQSFIYTIYSEGALKNLRARSFYLEIMMEHMADTLLERLELSRANLIYTGGGHCYMLLANTDETKDKLALFQEEANQWFIENYGTALYVAMGYASCSAMQLKNEPAGSYSAIFREISGSISERKSRRYSAKQIIALNSTKAENYTRECRVCKRLGRLDDKNECDICSAISSLSGNVLNADFFIIRDKCEGNVLALPFGAYMNAESEKSLREKLDSGEDIRRIYGKNRMYTGKKIATRLWVGNYNVGQTFEELAKQAAGTERIGILRADVDNLGRTFVSGFENEKNGDRYVTLSRTAALSRQLSMFFKYHINEILSKPVYTINGEKKSERKAAIVYSGGDDLFIAGAWDDVVELAADIKTSLEKYTENTLTISAGIGIYKPGYPIHIMADEVAELESDSKALEGKNGITFLPDGCSHEEKGKNINDGSYHWDEFLQEVIGEKYKDIYKFFENSEDRGSSFLYNLLYLIRNRGEKINIARYAYLLSRMEPDSKASESEKKLYKEFSKKMYQWIKNDKDCRQLKTAINLYAYMIRKKEEER